MLKTKILLLLAIAVSSATAAPFAVTNRVTLANQKENKQHELPNNQDEVTRSSRLHAKAVHGVSRGGGIGGLDLSGVVKLHGYAAFALAAMFFLESFGIGVPYVGPAATLSGFNGSDPIIAHGSLRYGWFGICRSQ